MPDPTKLTIFLAAAFLLAITPGPGIFYVLARSLAGRQREGSISSLGTFVGGLVHVVAAAAGISAVLAASAMAFSIVKYAGAAYLVYLGIRMIQTRHVRADDGAAAGSGGDSFRQGIWTEVLNPKTALFFLAFIPQFVSAASGHVFLQFLVLGTISVTLNTLADLTVAMFAGLISDRLRANPRLQVRQRVRGRDDRAWGIRGMFRVIALAVGILRGVSALAQPMPADVTLAAIRADEEQRDRREKLPEIILALHLGPGSVVGDLGAGYGYYAVRFSKAVGPNGRVYAEEIDAPLVGKIRERIRADQLRNVTAVLGTPLDPKFPENALDAVILSDVYHEIARPDLVLSRVRQALKPGGLLMIVDYLKPELLHHPRAEQTKEHNIAPAFVEEDLSKAGFVATVRRDPYCPGYDGIPTYFIVARR